MKCSKCGNDNLSDAKFCDRCGNKLETSVTEHISEPVPEPSARNVGMSPDGSDMKKMFGLVAVVFIALAIVLVAASGVLTDNGDDRVPVSDIIIHGSDTVQMGDTVTLRAEVFPSDATCKDITWSVSAGNHGGYYIDANEDIVIIGVTSGSVTVTAKSQDGVEISVSKTVNVTDATLDVQTVKLSEFVGGEETLTLDADVDLLIIDGCSVNPETYLISMPDGVGCMPGRMNGYSYVMIPELGRMEFEWANCTSEGTTYGSFSLITECMITYMASEGIFSNGQKILVQAASGPVSLPEVSNASVDFLGWYDAKENGEFVGMVGDTYAPTGDITIYALWKALVVESEYRWTRGDNNVFQYTPNVTDSLTGTKITDFRVRVPSEKDTTDCLREDGSSVYGVMGELLPGTYTARVTVSKTGYESATQTVIITIPDYTLESMNSTAIVGQRWYTSVELKPNDAYISSYSVSFNGEIATSGQFVAGKSGNRGFYITCNDEGTYTIELVISISGVPLSTKTITLRAESSDKQEGEQGGSGINAPSIRSVKLTKYGSSDPNTYYISAIGAANYDLLIWDFGDGTVSQNTSTEQVHGYIPGVYVIKCTVKNVTTGQTATASVKLETYD